MCTSLKYSWDEISVKGCKSGGQEVTPYINTETDGTVSIYVLYFYNVPSVTDKFDFNINQLCTYSLNNCLINAVYQDSAIIATP